MSVFYDGNTWTVSVDFQQLGIDADPASPPTFTLTLPNGTQTTETYGIGGSTIVKDSVGHYHRDVYCTLDGNFTGVFAAPSGAGAAKDVNQWFVQSVPLTTLGSSFNYPYAFGYCDVSHITSRILGGTWDPLSNTAQAPNLRQVNDFIAEASADIDLRLVRTGYTIPLTAQPNMVIAQQVWIMLRTICAELVAGAVLQSRYGSYDPQAAEAKEAEFHIQLADDLLGAIEEGAINFTVMGVAGPFEPDIDPAHAIVVTNLYDSTTGLPQTARFTNAALSVFDPH